MFPKISVLSANLQRSLTIPLLSARTRRPDFSSAPMFRTHLPHRWDLLCQQDNHLPDFAISRVKHKRGFVCIREIPILAQAGGEPDLPCDSLSGGHITSLPALARLKAAEPGESGVRTGGTEWKTGATWLRNRGRAEREGTSEEQDGTTGRQRGVPPEERELPKVKVRRGRRISLRSLDLR